MLSEILPIVELYLAIQGEGSRPGLPNILLRFTGCTHRCCFAGDWCDSWHTSLHPEKGKFTWARVVDFFEENRRISNLMLTGGSPTMHPQILQKIIYTFQTIHQGQGFITLETEGSHFVDTNPRIDLVSLSPKLSNSIPPIGSLSPKGAKVDWHWLRQHEKYRMQLEVMHKMISTHRDYHLKIVIDHQDKPEIWAELEALERALVIPRHKIFLMPAGSDLIKVQKNYAFLLPICVSKGYAFSGRSHIVAFGNKRET